MVEKIKSKRTVADWQAIVREKEAEAWRYRLILNDMLMGPPRHVGAPVRVVLTKKETNERSAYSAAIHRPLGANPLVLVIYDGGFHIDSYERWSQPDPLCHPDFALLKERARIALNHALEEDKA